MDPPALTLGNGAPLPSPPSISNVSAHSIVEPPPVYLIRSEHPQIHLSWASHFPQKVDKLKLRKDIKFFPVKITLKADYSTATREFEYGCSAKVTLLKPYTLGSAPVRQLFISQNLPPLTVIPDHHHHVKLSHPTSLFHPYKSSGHNLGRPYYAKPP